MAREKLLPRRLESRWQRTQSLMGNGSQSQTLPLLSHQTDLPRAPCMLLTHLQVQEITASFPMERAGAVCMFWRVEIDAPGVLHVSKMDEVRESGSGLGRDYPHNHQLFSQQQAGVGRGEGFFTKYRKDCPLSVLGRKIRVLQSGRGLPA